MRIIATLANGYIADIVFKEGLQALGVECGMGISHILVGHS